MVPSFICSPVTGSQGHILTEDLLCARHAVHVGELGSCGIPDLSELGAQLAVVSLQSCWSVVCSLLHLALGRQEHHDWPFP